MIKVKAEERLRIEEVVGDSLFDSVRHLNQMPPLDIHHAQLRELCDDFIRRGNVYKLEGEQSLSEKINNFKQELLSKVSNQEYWLNKLDHVFVQAKYFVFDIDPCHDLLEAVKS